MDTRQYWPYTIATGATDKEINEDLTNLRNNDYELVMVEPRGDGRVICILERARDDDPQQDTPQEYLVKSFSDDTSDDVLADKLSEDSNCQLVSVMPRDGKLTCFFRLLMSPVFSDFIKGDGE